MSPWNYLCSLFSQLIIDNWHIVDFTPAYVYSVHCTYSVQYRETCLWVNISIINTDNENFVIFIPEYAALYSFGSFIIEFQLFESLPFVRKFKLNFELLLPFIGLIRLLLIVQFFFYSSSLSMESIKIGSWILSSVQQQQVACGMHCLQLSCCDIISI